MLKSVINKLFTLINIPETVTSFVDEAHLAQGVSLDTADWEYGCRLLDRNLVITALYFVFIVIVLTIFTAPYTLIIFRLFESHVALVDLTLGPETRIERVIVIRDCLLIEAMLIESLVSETLDLLSTLIYAWIIMGSQLLVNLLLSACY